MNLQEQVDSDIPALATIGMKKWPGDVSSDSDYSETESDDSGGSSEDWEVCSESESDSNEEESSDTDNEEGYVLPLILDPVSYFALQAARIIKRTR
jgi:hypothetical protein